VNRANADDFCDRYATCPLCRRLNVRVVFYAGGVVLEEHASDDRVAAHPEPLVAGRLPDMATANLAHVRCPLSLAPLVTMEEP
jgi:hypothetical protein